CGVWDVGRMDFRSAERTWLPQCPLRGIRVVGNVRALEFFDEPTRLQGPVSPILDSPFSVSPLQERQDQFHDSRVQQDIGGCWGTRPSQTWQATNAVEWGEDGSPPDCYRRKTRSVRFRAEGGPRLLGNCSGYCSSSRTACFDRVSGKDIRRCRAALPSRSHSMPGGESPKSRRSYGMADDSRSPTTLRSGPQVRGVQWCVGKSR